MKSTQIRHRASGIYVISNEITGAKYYGSAWRVGVRRQRHLYDLRAGSHMNPHLQAAWNKYGKDAFTFRVLAYVGKDDLLATEQRLLDRHYGQEDCYNISPVAGAPMAGRKHKPESIEQMRKKITGLKRSEESRARYSAANKKKGVTRQFVEAGAAARRGKKLAPEHIEKIVACRRGKKQKPETVEKRAAKLRGRKERPEVVAAKRLRRLSPEHKAKVSLARQGSVASEETRAKMAATHTGLKHSPETRAKCAAIRAAWWAKKKAQTLAS